MESQLEGEDGERLVREFTEEEIKDAIWDCEGSKSPGPDGFNLKFSRSCWDIIKGDLCRMLVEFHEHRRLV